MRPQYLRILSIAAGVVMLFLSVLFSANGLGFTSDNRFAVAVGWLIGITFTIIEFVFNEEGVNHSMMIVIMGVFCYIYGVTTNVLGLFAWSGAANMDAIVTMVSDNPLKAIIPILLGFIFELGAEPLILWGFTGSSKDFLTGLLGGVTKKNNTPQNRPDRPNTEFPRYSNDK